MSDAEFVTKAGFTRKRRTHCKHGHEFPADARWTTNWRGYSCRVCNECQRLRMARKREKPEFRTVQAENTRRWRENNPEAYKAAYTNTELGKRRLLLDARAGGCQKCGEKDPSCLDFHHRDPSTKEGHIGEFRRFGKARLLAEIAKCDVLCANCHRKHHRDERLTNSEGD